jgi:hypothetical protein
VTSPSAAKQFLDAGTVAEVYIRRQNLSDELKWRAHALRTDALARLGQLLLDMPKNTGRAGLGRPHLGDAPVQSPNDANQPPTLASLGIDPRTSMMAQQLAALPEETRIAIADDRLTLKQALRAFQRARVRPTSTSSVAFQQGSVVAHGMAGPAPWYDEDGITLYCADSRDVMPFLSPQGTVVTDPPFNIHFNYGGEYDDQLPGAEYAELLRVTLREPSVVIYRRQDLFTVARILDAAPREIVPWVFTGKWRPIMWMGITPKLTRTWWQSQRSTPDTQEHPTQMPEWIIQQILEATPGVEVVIDPFAGSGTTLVVAKRLGIRAIGIERSERYCAIAAARCRATARGHSVGAPEPVEVAVSAAACDA